VPLLSIKRAIKEHSPDKDNRKAISAVLNPPFPNKKSFNSKRTKSPLSGLIIPLRESTLNKGNFFFMSSKSSHVEKSILANFSRQSIPADFTWKETASNKKLSNLSSGKK
jgi:hypothetical protein